MTFDLATLMIMILFLFPILFGVVIAMLKRKVSYLWLLVESGFLMAGLIALIAMGDRNISTSLQFMGETITFSIRLLPLLLFLGLLAGLVILIWRDAHLKRNGLSRMKFILLNLSLSFGWIAFISGQFMIRFIALDIIGLLAGLSVIDLTKGYRSFKDFVTIFLVLRLGDLSLLVSILLINTHAGVLDITQMISSVSTMWTDEMGLALWGFLLAIMIKIGVWPFGYWIHRAKESASDISFWISGFLMPALGYYLIYRIIPIIMIRPSFQVTVILLGVLTSAGSLFVESFGWVKLDRFKVLGAVTGSVLLCAAVLFGAQSMLIFLLGLIFYRLLIFIQETGWLALPRMTTSIFPAVLNGILLAVNFEFFSVVTILIWILMTVFWVGGDWIAHRRKEKRPLFGGSDQIFEMLPEESTDALSKGAGWLNQHVERTFSSFAFSGHLLVNTAQWVNKTIEIGFFAKGITWLTASIEKFARWNTEWIEQRLEKAWEWMGKALLSLSEGTLSAVEVEASRKTDDLVNDALQSLEGYEQKVLKKRMRWDLVWIPVLLIGLLIFLVVL